ncbi:MAG: P-loop NTPase [Treponema sp.]|nr:P-loop NTPase [Treponema sp.]
MINILPIASGKGGVGKSATSVNLAIILAQNGKRVILADFDFGGANLHTLLGLKNNHAGMGNFIYKQSDNLSDLLQDTSVENLKFIAGDCLYPGTSNIDTMTKKKIIRKIADLDADYIILDLGAGTTYNTLDFFLLTHNSVVVTTPELTSILNAYSFMKSAAFRFFTAQFKARSRERKFIDEYIRNSTSGTEMSFIDLVHKTQAEFGGENADFMDEIRKFRPQVIVNMGETSEDLEMAKRFRALVFNKLGLQMDFVGFLPREPKISYAIATRTPLAISEPNCKFVNGIRTAAERILLHSYELNETMFTTDLTSDSSDLETLASEFDQQT